MGSGSFFCRKFIGVKDSESASKFAVTLWGIVWRGSMEDREWSGKVAVITGAAGGVGAALGEAFARMGAAVVLTGRSMEKLNGVAGKINGLTDTVVLDVSNPEAVEETVKRIMTQFGRIDIWVNNAGYGIFQTFRDASLDDIADMMDVNYMGTVRCTKAVLPHMLEAGRGNIVNIASMAGKIATAKTAGYSASKHAVLGFTNTLRQELQGTGVTVTAINPGPIDTPFFDRADPGGGYVKSVGFFMLKAGQIADAAVKAIRLNKAEVDLPFSAALGIKLYQLFPRLADRWFMRYLNKK
jgi:short-subunit dehydrogenase